MTLKRKTRRAYGNADNGEPIVSVTELISQHLGWSKNGLLWWAAKEGATAAAEAMANGEGLLSAIEIGRKAHNRKRDKAADAGSVAHEMIEGLICGEPVDTVELMKLYGDETVEKAHVAYNKFCKWWEATGYTLHKAEQALVDRRHGWGGTFDQILQHPDGRLIIADVKTGKSIYKEEVTVQLGGYWRLCLDLGTNITGGLVIHCPVEPDIPLSTLEIAEHQLDAGAQVVFHLLQIHKAKKNLGGKS